MHYSGLGTIMKNTLETFILNKDIKKVTFLIDTSMTILHANAYVKEIFKVEATNLIGANFNSFLEETNHLNPLQDNISVLENSDAIYGYSCPTQNEAGLLLVWDLEKKFLNENFIYRLSVTQQTHSNKNHSSIEQLIYSTDNILANLPGSIFWKDENSIYLGCNNKLANYLGLKSRFEIIGKSDFDLFKPNEAEYLIAQDQKIFQSKKEIVIHEYGTISNGLVQQVLTTKMPILNDKNDVVGVFGISIDLDLDNTASPQPINYRHPLAYSEFLSHLIEHMPGSVYWKDKDGAYLGCNIKMAELAGFNTPKDIIGKNDNQLSWQENAKSLRENDLAVMTSGKTKETEETVILGNGHIGTYMTNKVPLYNNDKTEVIGILGISLVITQQKNSERQLSKTYRHARAKQEEKILIMAELCKEITGIAPNSTESLPYYINFIRDYFEDIIARMPGLVFWKDNAGIYRGANDSVVKLHKVKNRSHLIGKTDFELFPDQKEAQRLVDNDEVVKQSGVPTTFEESARFKAGTESSTYFTHKVPLFDKENKISGILGISLDITERKKTELALQRAKETAENANQVLQVFAGAVAHELRTPLTTIANNMRGIDRYITSLYKGYLIAKKHNLEVPFIREQHLKHIPAAAKDILKEVNFSQSIINVNLAQVGIRNKPLDEPTKCSIKQCLTEALERYPFKNEKERELVTIEAPNDFLFMGSSLLMIHVILNLLKNALYFIESCNKGDINIKLKINHSNNQVFFRDTGPGIPSESIGKIFDQFYSQRQHGAGIGLAFCSQVINQFSGKITCHSTEGEFTEFIITLPNNTKDKNSDSNGEKND